MSFEKIRDLYFVFMCVLPAYMWTTCMQCLNRPEEGVRFPRELELKVLSWPFVVWELHPTPYTRATSELRAHHFS